MTAAGLAELVDTHCHLVLLEERGLLGAALESCAVARVAQLVTIGLDVDDSDRNRRLAEAHPGVWFTVGWHPHQPAEPDAAQLAALRELAAHPRCVGIGEIGLDYYWRPGYHEVPAATQMRSLRIMLELAGDCGLPVVVHDRDAHGDVIAELERGLRRVAPEKGPRGVLHCFSGGAGLAVEADRLGLLCSFAGTVTFPRSEPIQEAARRVPSASLAVETDAPFLAPVPHRGRPNLPGYVAATAAAVARLRDEDENAVRALCSTNARRLFRLPMPGAEPRSSLDAA